MLLPLGSMDEMGTPVTNRLNVLEVFRKVTAERGFNEISTPIVEYASTFVNTSVGMKLQDMMKWFNAQGEIEVLRPDWTTAIARALVKHPSPFKKWAYQGPIYDRKKSGLESRQAGIEIIDTPVMLGEMECLMTAVSFLRKINVGSVIIELAHTGIFEDFIQPLQLDDSQVEKLRTAMHAKRRDEVISIVLEHSDQDTANEFVSLIDAYGSFEILNEYKNKWKNQPQRLRVIEHLQKLVSILQDCGVDDVIIDLGQVKKLPYYSGIIFRGFLKEGGDVCFSGGRYDPLYEHFGRETSAVGLAFDVNVLADKVKLVSDRERICIIADEDTLAFADGLRNQYRNAIIDIQFSIDEGMAYDRVIRLVKDGDDIRVVE
ncbi:MAG: ATP phosphoribosyltransferase regulatory subunit [Tuberibacillus sp.]